MADADDVAGLINSGCRRLNGPPSLSNRVPQPTPFSLLFLSFFLSFSFSFANSFGGLSAPPAES